MIGDFVGITSWMSLIGFMWYGVLTEQFPLWLALVICFVVPVITSFTRYEVKK